MKEFLEDKTLSWKAKGMLAAILEGLTNPTIEAMTGMGTDQKAAVQSGLQELTRKGYLVRTKKRGEDGTFGWSWDASPTPGNLDMVG